MLIIDKFYHHFHDNIVQEHQDLIDEIVYKNKNECFRSYVYELRTQRNFLIQ